MPKKTATPTPSTAAEAGRAIGESFNEAQAKVDAATATKVKEGFMPDATLTHFGKVEDAAPAAKKPRARKLLVAQATAALAAGCSDMPAPPVPLECTPAVPNTVEAIATALQSGKSFCIHTPGEAYPHTQVIVGPGFAAHMEADLPNAGQMAQQAPCLHSSGACQFKLGECILPCPSCAGTATQAWINEAPAAEAAAVVADLKEAQASRARPIGIIGQGSLGQKLAYYLQERGVAAIAMASAPPPHLTCQELSPGQLAVLALQIPNGHNQLQEQRAQVAKAGIRAGLQQLGQRATSRTAPHQVKADNKKARKAAAKQLQQERTEAGRQRALAKLQPQQPILDTKQLLHTLAEAGIVIPPVVAGVASAQV